MLKNEKFANRNDHQNRKTEVFCNKNRKTDLKNSQNRKTENPNAPLTKLVTCCWGTDRLLCPRRGRGVLILGGQF